MKKISIFLIFIIISCNKKDCSSNEKIRKIETNIIAETLLKQNFINKSKDSYAVCNSFKKLKISTKSIYTDSTKKIKVARLPKSAPKILENTEIYIENLLEVNLNGEKFFKFSDSTNFVEQNNCFLEYTLPKTVSRNIKTIPVFQTEKTEDYIIISIPIFSDDNKKAYVSIDYYPKRYQYRTSVYLEKKGDFWKIITTKDNWNSY